MGTLKASCERPVRRKDGWKAGASADGRYAYGLSAEFMTAGLAIDPQPLHTPVFTCEHP